MIIPVASYSLEILDFPSYTHGSFCCKWHSNFNRCKESLLS